MTKSNKKTYFDLLIFAAPRKINMCHQSKRFSLISWLSSRLSWRELILLTLWFSLHCTNKWSGEVPINMPPFIDCMFICLLQICCLDLLLHVSYWQPDYVIWSNHLHPNISGIHFKYEKSNHNVILFFRF